ncbi:MAG: ABC transporter ATP-binding protein, partial [Acidobacteriota bacterium]
MSKRRLGIWGFAVSALGLIGLVLAGWVESPPSSTRFFSCLLFFAIFSFFPIASSLSPSRGSANGEPRPDRMGPLKVVRYALRNWRPHLRGGSVLLVLLLLQQGYGITIAYAMKRLVDDALPQRNSHAVMTILVVVAGAYVITVIATVAAEYFAAKISSSIMCEMRVRMFGQLQRLSLAYHSRTHSGDTIARFSADLGDIEKGVTTRIIDGVMSLIGLLVYIPFLFFLDVRLATVVVVCLPFVVIGGRGLSDSASKA